MRKLPRDCRIEEVDTGDKSCFVYVVRCSKKRAEEYRRRLQFIPTTDGTVARIRACKGRFRRRVVYRVMDVYVLSPMQRRGIATRLYELAAKEACRRRGRLGSFERERGAHSISFWEKQVAKGRAQRFKAPPMPAWFSSVGADASKWGASQDPFILDCNKASDLSGLK